MVRRMLLKTVAALACCVSTAAGASLRNGTFEDGLDGWAPRVSRNMGEVLLVDDGAGGRCVQFHKTVATPDYSCIGLTQDVAVDAHSEYLVSLRFRTVLKEGIVGHACRVFASGTSTCCWTASPAAPTVTAMPTA